MGGAQEQGCLGTQLVTPLDHILLHGMKDEGSLVARGDPGNEASIKEFTDLLWKPCLGTVI